MSLDTRCSAEPILPATQQFYPQDTEPCIETWEGGQYWHHGTGIAPADHPALPKTAWARSVRAARCGACGSDQVAMITLQWSVASHSGDLYYDYELICRACGQFTARAYCEND